MGGENEERLRLKANTESARQWNGIGDKSTENQLKLGKTCVAMVV